MTQAKVLLVSDDVEAGQFWAYTLKQKDLQITIVGSAQEAVDFSDPEAFDLVIINVCTPQLDGVALCRQLRTKTVNPILLFTYRWEESYLLEAYEAGIDECITKPIGFRLFLAKVVTWLRQSWTETTKAIIGGIGLDLMAFLLGS